MHTIEYYSVLKKKKKTLKYATTWMNLEDIMLRNRSQKGNTSFNLKKVFKLSNS